MPPIKLSVTLNNLSRPCPVAAGEHVRAACSSDRTAWVLHGSRDVAWSCLGSPAAAPEDIENQLIFVDVPVRDQPVAEPTVIALSVSGQLWARSMGGGTEGQCHQVPDGIDLVQVTRQ